ncbi:MAG: DNA polymerase III subunit delta, partial [Pseudomonadota bacterium]
RWLDQRMRAAGLEPDRQATLALAERVEGNLLAAGQEIDKLRLLKGEGPVTAEDITELVADSARFQLFAMIDAALSGRGDRAVRMARGLRAEASPVAVIAVMLTREVRLLTQLRQLLDRGGNLQQIYREQRVWDKKRMLLERALRRQSSAGWRELLGTCAALDRAVKGLDERDPWELTEDVLARIAATP